MTDFADPYYHPSRPHSQNKHRLSSSRNDLTYEKYSQEELNQIKADNTKLKKQLKEAQAKRIQITRECSQYQKKIQIMQQKIYQLEKRLDQDNRQKEGDKYRTDELRFLNKQLSEEIEQLRLQNQDVNEKLKYCNEVLNQKYEDLEEKTFKRIEQAMKRIKKSVHYLENLSPKEIEKTKEILIQNMRKANELLRGKISEDLNADHQITELMNPLKNLQQQLSLKTKQVNSLRQTNSSLKEQLKKHKKIERQLLPQYKDAIEKLKKNLLTVRTQLSQNQYQKAQIKKKYEEKYKELEIKYNQLYTEYRKNKLEKQIFENKLEELENMAEQEKERLIDQNHMLKKLYSNKARVNDSYYGQEELPSQQMENQIDASSEKNLYQHYGSIDQFRMKPTKPTYGDQSQEKRALRKNLSTKDLGHFRKGSKQPKKEQSRTKMTTSDYNFYKDRTRKYAKQKPQFQPNSHKPQVQQDISSDEDNYQSYEKEEQESRSIPEYYQEDSSMLSQQSLKNEICKIDQEIMQIQRNLNKELQAYK